VTDTRPRLRLVADHGEIVPDPAGRCICDVAWLDVRPDAETEEVRCSVCLTITRVPKSVMDRERGFIDRDLL
jgi:hypothetical protein